jgi:hypothetical protein
VGDGRLDLHDGGRGTLDQMFSKIAAGAAKDRFGKPLTIDGTTGVLPVEIKEGPRAEITKLLVDQVAWRLRAQRIEVEFSDEAVKLIAREGFDPEFGARPMRRTIQRLVENPLALRLHNEVPGIVVPDHVQEALRDAGPDGPKVGMELARELVEASRSRAQGVYLVAPFRRPLGILELLADAA